MKVDFMDQFLSIYNDYRDIYKPHIDQMGYLYHYTRNIDAIIGIVNGEFWATEMSEFHETNSDANEGILALRQLQDILSRSECEDYLPDTIRDKMQEYIADDEHINDFVSQHKTYVLSFCKNPCSEYMWKEYAKTGYMVVINAEKFVSNLYFNTKNNGCRDSNYLRGGSITYDNNKQIQNISEYLKRQFEKKDGYSAYGVYDDYAAELAVRHVMYAGNYFKRPYDVCNKHHSEYIREEEYRVLANVLNVTSFDKEFDNQVPEEQKNGKRHIVIYFDPSAIECVLCDGEETLKKLKDKLNEKDVHICTDKCMLYVD